MPERRIVIFDESGLLSARVEEICGMYRFELSRVRSVERLVAVLKERAACLILIAVESPSRTGFSAFTRARMTCRQPPPILLGTRSLPQSEFAVHSKQRWRADGYLQLDELDNDQLRRELGRWVRFGGKRKSAPETRSRARSAHSQAPSRQLAPDERGQSDDSGWRSELVEEGPPLASETPPPTEAAVVAEQREIEQARHEARVALEREQLRHRDELERLDQEHRSALENVRRQAAAEIAAVQTQARDLAQAAAQHHAAQLDALRHTHQLQISALKKHHESRSQAERAELEAEVETLERLLGMAPEQRSVQAEPQAHPEQAHPEGTPLEVPSEACASTEEAPKPVTERGYRTRSD